MAQNVLPSTVDRIGEKLLLRIKCIHRGYIIPGQGPSQCWEYALCKTSGKYGSIACSEDGRRICISTHRLSAAFFRLKEKDGSEFTLASETLILHDCDNEACFNPSHLKCGDKIENMLEAIARGLFTNQPKLDKNRIKLLRKWHKKGLLSRAAHALRITYVQALLAVKGRSYANKVKSRS